MKTVLVVGGGFAGLAAAVGAARELDVCGVGPRDVKIVLVNPDPFSGIRVRNYERDLSEVRVPLDDVLGPAGVERIEAEASGIEVANHRVRVKTEKTEHIVEFDRLVLAAGSRLYEPELPGLRQFSFNVDTYEAAARLNRHIERLAAAPEEPGLRTVLVIGAGLTGIETACEMPEKWREAARRAGADAIGPRIILADHAPRIGSDMGEYARPLIEQALQALGIERRVGVRVASIDAGGARLEDGERIEAATVVWSAGMRANPLTATIDAPHDRLGRLAVDEYLRVKGVADVFAAGDVAAMPIDDAHLSVMSCQHARPMGRFAGYNAVCHLLGHPMLPLRLDWYVTCLDLGGWGALYTEGWERRVAAVGTAGKAIKQTINCVRIYPPRSGNRREILDWAAPVVQAPPLRPD